jgi:hypothetical protein
MAFKGPPLKAQWDDIVKRAKVIEAKTGLETASWASGLRHANARQENHLAI